VKFQLTLFEAARCFGARCLEFLRDGFRELVVKPDGHGASGQGLESG
jgi:hypothetical protein